MKRLISRRTATFGLAPVLAAPALRAQPAFPNKPLRMIVPYPPGGSTDIIGRLSAEAMGQHLGHHALQAQGGGRRQGQHQHAHVTQGAVGHQTAHIQLGDGV
jgi:tripartite-type tricarboxylate transporter receptor subunit TctC